MKVPFAPHSPHPFPGTEFELLLQEKEAVARKKRKFQVGVPGPGKAELENRIQFGIRDLWFVMDHACVCWTSPAITCTGASFHRI